MVTEERKRVSELIRKEQAEEQELKLEVRKDEAERGRIQALIHQVRSIGRPRM